MAVVSSESSRFRRGRERTGFPWRRHLPGYLFLLPAIVLYGVFVLYPFVQSIYLSLTDWDGARPVKTFVGAANYGRLIHDPLVWTALRHNLIWVVVGTVAPIVIGLPLAVLLRGQPRGFSFFRTVYFMPQVLSTIVIAIIWGWIYNPVFGILNQTLVRIGLGGLSRGWLGDTHYALYAVLAAAIWAEVGFVFVVFLAGLQNVSQDLLDAATVDGASSWSRFWNVILPELANVLNLIIALLLIGGFNVFDIVFIMTGGGPANATEVIATYTFKEAFAQSHVGYAATLSLVMTVIALISSVVFMRLRERGAD